jgi:hypothetical protein
MHFRFGNEVLDLLQRLGIMAEPVFFFNQNGIPPQRSLSVPNSAGSRSVPKPQLKRRPREADARPDED